MWVGWVVRTLRLLLIELRQEEEVLKPARPQMHAKQTSEYKPQATYAHTAWELEDREQWTKVSQSIIIHHNF